MHDGMRSMVDEEKKSALEALLKQLYERMAEDGNEAFAGKETPGEEVMEKVAEAEGEEMAEEMVGGDEMEMGEEIASFMKNRRKPKVGKSIGVMIKMPASKPMKKSMKA